MSEKRTVSLAISAELLCKHNRNLEQLTYAVYQIARNACLYKVAEVVVLGEENKETILVGSLFQFFITPRYLVKETFSRSLGSGALPKNVFNKGKTLPAIPGLLDFLHPAVNKRARYREGISINKNFLKHRTKTETGKVRKINKNLKTTRHVQVGLDRVVELGPDEDALPLNVRVSVDVEARKVVSVQDAWGDEYTGYSIRVAKDVVEVFTEAPIGLVGEDGYDMGVLVPAGDMFDRQHAGQAHKTAALARVGVAECRRRKHPVLVVAGGELAAKGAELGVFDCKLELPSRVRGEDGAVAAMGKLCTWGDELE